MGNDALARLRGEEGDAGLKSSVYIVVGTGTGLPSPIERHPPQSAAATFGKRQSLRMRLCFG
jgi:hypothetical protein